MAADHDENVVIDAVQIIHVFQQLPTRVSSGQRDRNVQRKILDEFPNLLHLSLLLIADAHTDARRLRPLPSRLGQLCCQCLASVLALGGEHDDIIML